jgi:undecaprenyl-diphosphatase
MHGSDEASPSQSGSHLDAAGRMLAAHETRVVAAEVPAEEAQGRGRLFLIVYVASLLIVVGAFAALALTARSDDLLRVDVDVTRALQRVSAPAVAWILIHTSDLGFVPGNIVSYAAVFLALAALRLWVEAILALGATLLALWVGGLIKVAVARPRPADPSIHMAAQLGGYSFPSGHVIQYTVLFGFTFYVVLVVWRHRLPRDLILVVLAALIVLVGPSRVYLGEHWPSDVLGAYLFAALWLAGTIELHLLLRRRFHLNMRRSARPNRPAGMRPIVTR